MGKNKPIKKRPPPKNGFKKGHPRPENAGRRVGTPNKRTVFVKGILEDAVRNLGGLDGLLKWIRRSPENESIFWGSMFMKLLPVQVLATMAGETENVPITREELAKKLEERGLPPIVFGAEVPQRRRPMIDITPRGNGHDKT